jgi:hypothetical protein
VQIPVIRAIGSSMNSRQAASAFSIDFDVMTSLVQDDEHALMATPLMPTKSEALDDRGKNGVFLPMQNFVITP